MASLHEINGGYLGTRLELPSSEPSFDFFASFQGSGEPSAPNAAYGENDWAHTSRDSDGYAFISGNGPKVIFSQPLTSTGTWTLEFYAKSDTTSPEWVCLWTGLDQRHRALNIAQFHYYGDPGVYNNTAHYRSSVTTHDGNWHHYMWSNNAGTLSFYVDGTQRITNPSGQTGGDLYGLWLGDWHAAATSYSAAHYFKNMRVTYGSALTAASPLPTYAAGATPSGVYKLGSKDSLITSFATAGSSASLIKKVGRLDAPSPQNWFAAGYVGVDLSAFFENGKTYTQFKIRRPQTTNARTLTPCIMGRDINKFYAVGGFTATIPGDASASVGDTITFDLTDPNLPGKFGSFTVPFGGQYFMGWHSGDGSDANQIALLTEIHSSTRDACIHYVQTTNIPSLTNTFGMTSSDRGVAQQMEWS